ncbi:oligosaccharide flippase family protein [Lichenifustis flavocetrariae]|uniref:Oligosaccharide flippase family protein n=1 Tax=Lichenifustis flavocetrariae TaxID=2949735 RepID=A0AA42CL88_9HYPH|nr:oligosaccharide flippase family protein [Lichenifustis flavocetrariae]MCW6511343.1 oligosaccharide flippase family protein [Lichenifustis flavocetrariae]
MAADVGSQELRGEAQAASRWEFAKVLRNASYLMVAQVATRIAGFAYVLLLARVLPEAQFGLLNLALSVLLIADMIADLGLSRLTIRDLSRDGTAPEPIVARLLSLRLILSSLTYVVMITVAWRLSGADLFASILMIAGLSLLPSGLATILESVLHAQQRFSIVALARGCLSLGQVGLGISVLLAGGGVEAVAATFALAYGGFFAALAWALTRSGLRLRLTLDAAFSRKWMVAAVPFALVGVIFALNLRVELLVLGWFADAGGIATYGMGLKVVEAALLATLALGTALTPLFSRYYAQSRPQLVALYLRSLGFAFLLTIPASLVAMVTVPPVLRLLLPSAYDPVGPLLHIVFAGFPFWVAYYLNASLLLGTDRQIHATAVLGGALAVQLVVSLILIPPLGATGAAGAFAVSGCLSWLGTTVYVERLLGLGTALAGIVGRPFAGGAASIALVLAGSDWCLPLGLAVFTLVMMTDRSVRALVLRHRPSPN